MRFPLALAALAALFALSPLAPLLAQRDNVQLHVEVVAASARDDGPLITTANLLADPKTRELLRSGFPTRIHFELELWRKRGLFDDPSGRVDWYVVVRWDPTSQLYNVVRRQDPDLLENFGGFQTATSADAQFGRPFRASLHPNRSGRFYYNLIVEVQTLSESDLDALQQFFRGPSAPGKSNPLTAIRSGVGTLVSRVLGDKRTYKEKSGTFEVP
ncbi:MAG: hypothetical protein ABJF01_24950 [bacterium]